MLPFINGQKVRITEESHRGDVRLRSLGPGEMGWGSPLTSGTQRAHLVQEGEAWSLESQGSEQAPGGEWVVISTLFYATLPAQMDPTKPHPLMSQDSLRD